MKPISAARAKAELLALLDTVERTHQDVVITKRGRPVARLAPLIAKRAPLKARARLTGDVVSPLEETWAAP
jgi:prevent-host-death family protein